jgi:hypothetical protein
MRLDVFADISEEAGKLANGTIAQFCRAENRMRCSVLYAAPSALVLFATIGCRHQAATASVPPPSPPPAETMQVDQVNTEGWDKAWTNLLNVTEQSFTPSLPKLRGVEVGLIVGNAGEPEDELTLTILDEKDQKLASVTQTVKVGDADHVMFLLPEGGLPVTPGRGYAIQLSGGVTFGWKYVVGGYENGEATFNGRPLLADARSTFLFRTFGGK